MLPNLKLVRIFQEGPQIHTKELHFYLFSTNICVNPILSAEHLPQLCSSLSPNIRITWTSLYYPSAAPQHQQDGILNNGEINSDPEIVVQRVVSQKNENYIHIPSTSLRCKKCRSRSCILFLSSHLTSFYQNLPWKEGSLTAEPVLYCPKHFQQIRCLSDHKEKLKCQKKKKKRQTIDDEYPQRPSLELIP